MLTAGDKGKCDYCTLLSLPDCDCFMYRTCFIHRNQLEVKYFFKKELPYLNLKKLFLVLPSLPKILPGFELNSIQQFDFIKEAVLKDYKVSIEYPTVQVKVEVSLTKQIFVVHTKDSFLLVYDANSNKIIYSINLKTRILNYSPKDFILICIGSYLDIIILIQDQKTL